jgi:hypothetical protein
MCNYAGGFCIYCGFVPFAFMHGCFPFCLQYVFPFSVDVFDIIACYCLFISLDSFPAMHTIFAVCASMPRNVFACPPTHQPQQNAVPLHMAWVKGKLICMRLQRRYLEIASIVDIETWNWEFRYIYWTWYQALMKLMNVSNTHIAFISTAVSIIANEANQREKTRQGKNPRTHMRLMKLHTCIHAQWKWYSMECISRTLYFAVGIDTFSSKSESL